MMEKSELFTLDFSFLQKELKNETKFISKSFELKLESLSLTALLSAKKKKSSYNNFLPNSQIIYSLLSQEKLRHKNQEACQHCSTVSKLRCRGRRRISVATKESQSSKGIIPFPTRLVLFLHQSVFTQKITWYNLQRICILFYFFLRICILAPKKCDAGSLF